MSQQTQPNVHPVWDQLAQTNPDHTKQFERPGGFKGNDINPQYRWQKLTEVFGPAGIGWGTCQETVWTQPMEGGQILVFVRLKLWYLDPGTNEIGETPFGCGGDFIVKQTKRGLTPDDEGYKKAYTDALGNAARFLGLGADVYMGLFDDSKYINALREQFNGNGQAADDGPDAAERTTQDIINQLQACTTKTDYDEVRNGPIKQHWNALSGEQQARVQDIALSVAGQLQSE